MNLTDELGEGVVRQIGSHITRERPRTRHGQIETLEDVGLRHEHRRLALRVRERVDVYPVEVAGGRVLQSRAAEKMTILAEVIHATRTTSDRLLATEFIILQWL